MSQIDYLLGAAGAYLNSIPQQFNPYEQTGHIVGVIGSAQSYLAAALPPLTDNPSLHRPVADACLRVDARLRTLDGPIDIHRDMGLVVGALVANGRELADAAYAAHPHGETCDAARRLFTAIPEQFVYPAAAGTIVGHLAGGTRLLVGHAVLAAGRDGTLAA